jgi:UDP-glucose 4-epimerase
MLFVPKSILVTGGAGFIGSWLVRELLDRFHDAKIVVIDNLYTGRVAFLPDSTRVYFEQVDLRDQKKVLDVVRENKPELVFHLAAIHFIPHCNAYPIETLQVNVVGTQILLEALRQQTPQRVVIASSAAIYPIMEGPNHEDDSAGPVDIYGLTKLMNEAQLEVFSRVTETLCAAARLFNVFGSNETNPHVIPEIFNQIGKNVDTISLGNIEPKRDYIYVSDVAQALIAIAEKNTHFYRVYNVGSGKEYSVREILDCINEISGRHFRVSISVDRQRKADRMHLLSHLGRISEEIGWKPRVDLQGGLSKLWEAVG